MIICQIITTLVYGGAEKLLVNFSNVLVEKHDVHIIYLKGDPKLKPSFDSRIHVHHIPLSWKCPRAIRSLLKKLKPDVVHTHLGHADLIGLWASRGLPLKQFCTMHNVYFKWNWLDKIFFFLYYISFKTHARNCHVSCISNAVAKHTHETLGVSLRKITVNYNAIPDLPSFISKKEARLQLNIAPENFCALTIGRLRVQKSTETILYAAEKLKGKIKNLQVLIVGEGELERDLKAIAGKLQIDDIVQFRGGTQTPEKYFAAADVFVLPSVFEGLPTVVLEAFRASIPVVGTRIDGTTELIEDNVNGVLFEPKNADQLATCVLRLFESNELREKLGRNGFTSYRNKYDIRSYAKQIESLYLA